VIYRINRFFFGITKKRFYNFKRVVVNKNIGPIVKTVMSRCIHCTRCVRFASEVAGVGDMGMFGRGLNSEIGTYVEKVFQSELSGNVIDLCPVGALTSKPYPFVNRSWELKNVNSIDFSDGFGLPTQVFIKNKQIIKILPSYDKTTYSSNWISDKTRFSFDSMFSPEKHVYNFIDYNKKESKSNLSWKNLLKELFLTIYFQIHLSNHFFKPHKITICVTSNVNLEVLSLLLVLSNKYPFFILRQSEFYKIENDIEMDYLLNPSVTLANLRTTNVCMLIGLNTRYESFNLNLRLKSRQLKGDFSLLTIGSLTDLTIPYASLGNNLNVLTSLAEGNNVFCQEFCNSTNPILICSSEVFKRKDSSGLTAISNTLTQFISKYSYSKTHNPINILNSTINKAGMKSLNICSPIKNKDIQESAGIYFLNDSYKTANVKKFINLKLLNFLKRNGNKDLFLITQHTLLKNKFITRLKKNFKVRKHINLPNNVFFETSGTYLNTEGVIKKTVKLVSPTGQTKNNWQLLRKIFSYSNKISFKTLIMPKNKLAFNSNTMNYFKNYIGFQHYAINNLNKLSFYLLNSTSNLNLNKHKFKYKRKKLFNTQFKYWLNDFYIGSNDGYSEYSSTMLQCSKFYRLNNTNFSHEVYRII